MSRRDDKPGDLDTDLDGRQSDATREHARTDEPTSSFLAVPAAARLAADITLTQPITPRPGADDIAPATSSATLPPEQRYQLEECLGRGGMGRVHRARDTQLERDVALKFLDHDDPTIRRMFLREARIQARVRHANVVDVFDSGEWDGTPFVSMRLIEGRTLAKAAEGLPLEARLRLLIQVAEGLDAAHRVGLAHRDIKPGNILIEETADGELQAQLIDFGLAVDVAGVDRDEELIAGSPQYIAPERLRPGAVVEDRRADIYSLGITLFRVLTGVLPFDDQSLTELLRVPNAPSLPLPPPRSVSPDLPPELEAIILRCAAADPSLRYGTAHAVAVDLQRYLDGEVVDAYAASLAYRLTRFVLRNRLVTALAGAAVLAVVAGSVAVGVFALRADAARERAELRQGQAEELIRFMVVDLHEKLDELGRLDVISDIGDAAMEYFATVPDSLRSDDERLRHSRALYQIGQTRIRQGNNAEAVESLERSLYLARALVEAAPDNQERLFELGHSHFWLGYLYWRQGDLARARTAFEAYRDISARLVDLAPENPEWRRELAHSHSNLGSLLRAEGGLHGALEQFQSVLQLDRALAGENAWDDAAQGELAASNNMVGLLLQDIGQLVEAGEFLEHSVAIRRALVEREQATPRARDFLATSLNDLGVNRSMRGDWLGAEALFRESNQLLQWLTAHDSANASWTAKLAWSHVFLARAALAAHDDEAVHAGARALEHLNAADEALASLPDVDSNVAWRRARAVIVYHRAVAEQIIGRRVPAIEHIESALAMLTELATALPGDRSVHRWLGQAHVVDANLRTDPMIARAAWQNAVHVLAPFIEPLDQKLDRPGAPLPGSRVSSDWRMVLPWSIASACLGERAAVSSAQAALAASGYSEPGLRFICPPGGLQH